MPAIRQIELPLAGMGSVNVWLILGEPLALVDTGPATAEALDALEAQLGRHGVRVEDVEMLVLTHHHLDHTGLAALIKQRSGAQVVAHRATARWGPRFHERAEAERRFTIALMAAHGVPAEVIAGGEGFFEGIVARSRPFTVDRLLADGDAVLAGGRRLRAIFRPGHSTTDTLFVDVVTSDAFVGDHLLANVTSGVELMPSERCGDERRRGLLEYLRNLRRTQAMELRMCYAGHGPLIEDHRALIDDRLAFHADRLERIAGHVADGCATPYEIAGRLWSEEVAAENPVLVTWEVLGHLDVLVRRGVVRENVDERGRHRFSSATTARAAAPGTRARPTLHTRARFRSP